MNIAIKYIALKLLQEVILVKLTHKLVLVNGICTLIGFLYATMNSYLQGYSGTLVDVVQFEWIALILLLSMMHLASFMAGKFFLDPDKRLRRIRLCLLGVAAVPLYVCLLVSFVIYEGTCDRGPCHYFDFLFQSTFEYSIDFGILMNLALIWSLTVSFFWLMAWLLIYGVTDIVQEHRMSKTS